MIEKQIDGNLLSALNYAMDGMVTFRANGTIEFFNRAAEEIFGHSQLDVYGQNISILFPELKLADPNHVVDYFKKNHIRGVGGHYEILAEHKEGYTFPLELHFGEINLPLGIVYWGIFRDLTEEKKNEQNLHNTNIILDSVSLALAQFIKNKSKDELLSIFNQLLFDIITVSRSYHGLFAKYNNEAGQNKWELLATSSEAWEEQFGLIFDGNGMDDPLLLAIKPFILKSIETAQTLIENGITSDELPDEQHSFLAMPLINKEQLVGIVVLVNKLTKYNAEMMQLMIPVLQASVNLIEGFENELRRVETEKKLKTSLSELELINSQLLVAKESAQMASQAKSSFLANMSHEIRTPLNGIMGMTELLLHTHLDAKQKKFAQTVYDSSEVLLNLINDILDLSKIEAGELKLEALPSNIAKILKEVVLLLYPRAQEKQIELLVYLAPDIPDTLMLDPTRVRQVVTNLVHNAIKFTESGFVKVLLTKKKSKRKDIATIRFEVIDSGIGISPEEQKKLFSKFSQADTSTTRKYGGSGLGLSISKKLVEKMHGKIGLESEKGKGSKFWFEIPFATTEISENKKLMPIDDLKGVPVVVIGGHDASNDIILKYLRDWNMKSTLCPTLEEAIGKLQKKKAEKSFIINAEDIRGEKAQKIVHGNTVIINVVDDIDTPHSDKTHESKTLAYISKPLYPDELQKALVDHLFRKENEV